METTQSNNSKRSNKNDISTILSKIFIFGFLMACAIFGSLADAVCALIFMAFLIYIDAKMRGAQNG